MPKRKQSGSALTATGTGAGLFNPVVKKLRKGKRPAGTSKGGQVAPLEVGTYGDLKSREKVGDNLEHDHIPSSAALKKAKEKELGRKLTPREARDIHQRGIAIEVPKEVHAKSDTFRGRNTPERVNTDAEDLGKAAERDYATTRQNLIDHGYPPNAVDDTINKAREMNRRKGI